MDITCDGVVIRETEYKDNDKILTFLTADYGKITVTARGVRSIKSKNSPAVQLFCSSTFEMTEKNGHYTLKTATLNDSFYAVRDNLECFSLASYFADVAGTVCSENNDEKEMLRLILNCLYAMSRYRDIPLWRIKAAFELKCMQANGLTPDFNFCSECGKAAADSTDKNGMYLFSPEEGTPLCPECLKGREKGNIIPISTFTIDAAQYILSSPQSRMLKFYLPEEKDIKREFSVFCERYLCCQTGRRYETLAFYKTVCNM